MLVHIKLHIQFGLKKCSETQPYSEDKDFVDLLNCC